MALPELQNDSEETVAIMLAADELVKSNDKMDATHSVLSEMLTMFKTIEYSMNAILMGALDTLIDQNGTMINLLGGVAETTEEAASNQFASEEDKIEEDRDAASNQFASEEDKIEGDRKEGGIMAKMFAMFKKSENGGSKMGDMMSGGFGFLGGIGKSLMGLLGGGALLAFLYFLPEFLDSKLFKEMKILVEEKIIPLFKMLYEDVLKPIGTYLYDGLLDFMEDLNDPEKGLWSIISENAGFLLTAVGGILIAAAPGLALTLGKSLLTLLGPLLFNPVTLVVAGIAAFISGLKGAGDALENASEILNKAEEDITLADKASLLVSGFIGGIASLVDTVLGFFGIDSDLQTKVFDFMLDATNGLFNDIQEWIAEIFKTFKLFIYDLSPDIIKDKVSKFLGLSSDDTTNDAEIDRAKKRVTDQEDLIAKKKDNLGSRYNASMDKMDTALLNKRKDQLKELQMKKIQITEESKIGDLGDFLQTPTGEEIAQDRMENPPGQDGALTRMEPAKVADQKEVLTRVETETPATGEILDKGSAANAAAGMQVIISSPTTTIVDASVKNQQQSTNVTQSPIDARSSEPTVAQMVGAF